MKHLLIKISTEDEKPAIKNCGRYYHSVIMHSYLCIKQWEDKQVQC